MAQPFSFFTIESVAQDATKRSIQVVVFHVQDICTAVAHLFDTPNLSKIHVYEHVNCTQGTALSCTFGSTVYTVYFFCQKETAAIIEQALKEQYNEICCAELTFALTIPQAPTKHKVK